MISLLLPVLVPMAARQITLKFYGVEQLLTQYTCFANSCKILLSDSVGQQFRQGTTRWFVCSMVSQTSAERLDPEM